MGMHCDFSKLVKIAESCETKDHALLARNVIRLFAKMYKEELKRDENYYPVLRLSIDLKMKFNL